MARYTFTAPCTMTVTLNGTTRHDAETRLQEALTFLTALAGWGEGTLLLDLTINAPLTLIDLDDSMDAEPRPFIAPGDEIPNRQMPDLKG